VGTSSSSVNFNLEVEVEGKFSEHEFDEKCNPLFQVLAEGKRSRCINGGVHWTNIECQRCIQGHGSGSYFFLLPILDVHRPVFITQRITELILLLQFSSRATPTASHIPESSRVENHRPR